MTGVLAEHKALVQLVFQRIPQGEPNCSAQIPGSGEIKQSIKTQFHGPEHRGGETAHHKVEKDFERFVTPGRWSVEENEAFVEQVLDDQPRCRAGEDRDVEGQRSPCDLADPPLNGDVDARGQAGEQGVFNGD